MISEGNDLKFGSLFNFKIPKYLIIELLRNDEPICTFPCNIKNFDLMSIKKETIESNDSEIKKYYKDEVSGEVKASHILVSIDSKDDASDEEYRIKLENSLLKLKDRAPEEYKKVYWHGLWKRRRK